jgi:tetratricopeptide (TPR) repeat protein
VTIKKNRPRTKQVVAREADASAGISRAAVTAIVASAIIVAALIAYRGSFSGPFIFDDVESIVENPSIRHLSMAFDLPRQHGTTIAGRPLLALSFAANYALGGLDVRGYHAVNLALHVLAALALFGVVRRILESQVERNAPLQHAPDKPKARWTRGRITITGSAWIAGAIALLWAIHPLQTESVTYIVQRAEILGAFFYLLTLYAAVRAFDAGNDATTAETRPRGVRAWSALAFAACACGMASKETMVSAPLVVLLCDRTFFAGTFRDALRLRWKFHAALGATWLLLAWLVWRTGARGGTVGFDTDVTWWSYALKQCEAIVRYLGLSIWPRPLVLDYGTDVVRDWTTVWPQIVVLAALVATIAAALTLPNPSPARDPKCHPIGDARAARARRRAAGWRPAGFAGFCFFALLAPTSSVIPVATQTMAEHRMYLPLAAVLAGLVLAVWRFAGWRSFPVLALAAIACGALTIARNRDYRSAESIWSDTAEKQPGNARAHAALGNALLHDGRAQEALAPLERALAIDPSHATAHGTLGNALLALHRADEAIEQFRIAVKLRPDDFKTHGSLGNALLVSGRIPEAIVEQREAVRLAPDFAETHYNLALSLARAGAHADAIEEFRAALRLAPDHADAQLNLGTSLAMSGRTDEAIAACREAVRLRPTWVEARCNLGVLLAKAGRVSEAVSCFEQAQHLAPERADIRAMLQQLRTQAGR